MAKLGDVCEVLNGFAFKSDQYVESGIRIIRIANVQKGYIEDSSPAFYTMDSIEAKKYQLKENDLLMSLTGNVGRVGLLTSNFLPAALNQRVACLRIKDSSTFEKAYLFHVLNSDFFEQKCIESANGVAQKNMSTEWLKEYEIPLPPLDEQRRIAAVLDKVSDLIAKRREQLDKLDELVKARFVEMFGDVIQNERSWKQYIFSDIATSRLGKMLDAKQQTGKYEYPYLANFNVQWFRFELDNLNKMDFNEADQQEFELREGDLLVCEGGEIGRCAVWHNEIHPCYFQKALHRVRCNQRIIMPDYMAWWFKYNCDHNGFAAIEGAKATIAHLPGVKLKALKVTVPEIKLQEKFVTFLKQTDKSKLTIQQSLDKLEVLKKALMQQYFG